VEQKVVRFADVTDDPIDADDGVGIGWDGIAGGAWTYRRDALVVTMRRTRRGRRGVDKET
jgi:hypothetical protein